MRIKFLASVGIVFACLSVSVYACDGGVKHPCVVQDTIQGEPAAKHFRAGADFQMPTWWVSGSGAPSEAGWSDIKNKITTLSNGKATTLVDLDLRQESHLYLDGDGITLAIVHNWLNRGKTRAAALNAEHQWQMHLATLPSVPSVLTAGEFKSGNYNQGVTLPVTTLKNEAEVVKALGFRYERVMIADHLPPDPEAVDQLLYFIDNLPPKSWIHVHCRGGDGRTTTVMAMLDMLKNAGKDSFDDIIARQASVYPYYDLREIKQDDPLFIPYYVARLAFIKSFYDYAKTRATGNQEMWQTWLKRQPSTL